MREIVIGLGGRLNGVPRETGFDITVASRGHGHPRPGDPPQGPARAPRPHHRRRTPRAASRVTADDLGAGGAMAVLLQGRHQAEPDADARGQRRVRPRRPLRQHRPRQQLDHRRPDRPEARRLRRHRERLRRRPRRGEVHGHQVPRTAASRRAPWSSLHHARPQDARRPARSTPASCSRPRTTRTSTQGLREPRRSRSRT